MAGVVQAEPVWRDVTLWNEREAIPDAEHARSPNVLLPHRQFPLPQVASVETRQRLQVFPGVDVHETKIETGSLAEQFQGDASDRTPQCAAPRVVHPTGGTAGHDGEPAGPGSVLDPEGNERLQELDQARHRGLARGILGVDSAEEIDCLQIGPARPCVD